MPQPNWDTVVYIYYTTGSEFPSFCYHHRISSLLVLINKASSQFCSHLSLSVSYPVSRISFHPAGNCDHDYSKYTIVFIHFATIVYTSETPRIFSCWLNQNLPTRNNVVDTSIYSIWSIHWQLPHYFLWADSDLGNKKKCLVFSVITDSEEWGKEQFHRPLCQLDSHSVIGLTDRHSRLGLALSEYSTFHPRHPLQWADSSLAGANDLAEAGQRMNKSAYLCAEGVNSFSTITTLSTGTSLHITLTASLPYNYGPHSRLHQSILQFLVTHLPLPFCFRLY